MLDELEKEMSRQNVKRDSLSKAAEVVAQSTSNGSGKGKDKHEVTKSSETKKAFHYLVGICEGSETFATLALMCLLPSHFKYCCYGYGVLCILTTCGRVSVAREDFG